MKTTYILIDFENVQPNKVGLLDRDAFKIKVFVGAKQSRMLIELARALQPLGDHVEYVQIEGSGRNALDLHIAYFIGRLACEEPGAVFHIVSKDTDYDPLIDYLKQKKVICHRHSAMTDIPHTRPAPVAPKPPSKARTTRVTKSAKAKPPSQADAVIANLRKRGRALPSTVEKLTGSIKSALGNRISDEAVRALIEELKLRGRIVVKDGKVTYFLVDGA